MNANLFLEINFVPTLLLQANIRQWIALTAAIMFGILLSGCASTASITAKTVQSGIIQCFVGNPSPTPEKPATCELSAVAKVGDALIFANDKPIPGKQYSQVFSIPFDGKRIVPDGHRYYFLQAPFINAQKYESMTTTPDGQWVLAATAFDRYSKDKPEQDRYSTLLAWPAFDASKVSVVAATDRQGVVSSIALRDKFVKALDAKNNGIGYFKIEGLAAIPGNRLLFGVREIGASYKQPTSTIKVVEVGYKVADGKINLLDDYALVFDFTPNSMEISHKLGLSSLEYDNFNERLYLVTSFEESENVNGIGAYLWVLSLADLHAKKTPSLVKGADSKPLLFTHKAEGLGVLDKNRILIIHDDDRIITKVKADGDIPVRDRKLNESGFDVLEWQ